MELIFVRDVEVGMSGLLEELTGSPLAGTQAWREEDELAKGGEEKGGANTPLFPCLAMGNYEWPRTEDRLGCWH